MRPGSFKNVISKMCLQFIYLIYMYKEDLALNNLQWLICHKTKPKETFLTKLCCPNQPIAGLSLKLCYARKIRLSNSLCFFFFTTCTHVHVTLSVSCGTFEGYMISQTKYESQHVARGCLTNKNSSHFLRAMGFHIAYIF